RRGRARGDRRCRSRRLDAAAAAFGGAGGGRAWPCPAVAAAAAATGQPAQCGRGAGRRGPARNPGRTRPGPAAAAHGRTGDARALAGGGGGLAPGRAGPGPDAPWRRPGTGRGGGRLALRAGRIDAGPLLAFAALGDRLPPRLRAWLLAAAPDVQIHELVIARDAGGRVRAHARLQALAFASVGDTPGLAGLAGTLDGDAAGFRFQVDPESQVRFDWPPGFGAPHLVALRGDVVGWREGAGMRVGTPWLRVEGEG